MVVGASSKRSPGARDNQRSAASPRAKTLKGRPGDRGRQVIRQFTVLQALETARRGLTVQEIHNLLEEKCALRTVYRDIAQLGQAGFQLVENEGRWTLARSGATAAFALQPSEVLTLLVSEDLLAPVSTGGLAASLPELRRRLMAQLTAEGRALVNEMRHAVRGTNAAPLHLTQSSTVLDAIDEAIAKEQCLAIDYTAPGKATTRRVVEPHLLWVHGGRPYLVAFCRSSVGFRTFAIQRIKGAEVIEDEFDRRPEFDAITFTELGFGALHGAQHEVVVEFNAEVAHLAHERRWHATQRVESLEDGRARLTMTAAGLPEIAAWLASFGGKVRAIAPAELVRAVRDVHERGLGAYDET